MRDTRRLVFVAIDLSADASSGGEASEGLLAECIDEWGQAGLLDDVYLVDLATQTTQASQVGSSEFVCAEPGSVEVREVQTVLASSQWTEVIVASIRLTPLSKVTTERVRSEAALRSEVEKAYPPGSPCKTAYFTLSWVDGGLLTDAVLPREYTTNFVHDHSIYVGEQLAIASFDETNRHLSLAFTALIGSGGFVGQAESPFMKVAVIDGGLTTSSIVRPVRALARAASGGWFFRDVLQQAMSRTDFIMPSGVVNAVPDSGSQVILKNLVEETASVCRFSYVAHRASLPERKKVGLIRGLIELIRDIPRYIRGATRTVVSSEIADRIRPLADALQDVYGSNSIVEIRGSTVTDAGDVSDVTKLLQFFAQRGSEENDFRPLVDAKVWRDLSRIALGALDGSDLPEGIRSLTKSGRVIFTDPETVGPAPATSIFHVSPEEQKQLGIDEPLSFREPDILDSESCDRFKRLCTQAKHNIYIGHPTTDVSVGSQPIGGSTPTLRGRLISSGESFAGGVAHVSKEPRDARTLLDEFDKWLTREKDASRTSYLGQLAQHLEDEVSRASEDVNVAKLQQKLLELQRENDEKKRSRFVPIATGLGLAGILGVFATSQLKLVSLAMVPFIVIWLIVWLFGTATALAARVIKTAIKARQRDLERRSETELENLFNTTVTAMREYIRLKSLQSQFAVWSRIIREVIHNPYGEPIRTEGSADDITSLPHPRQFAIAKVEPVTHQLQSVLNVIRGKLLVKGYLQSILDGVIGSWRDKYRAFELRSVNQDPFADTPASWGQSVGVRIDGDPIFPPLQDFYVELVHRHIREEAAEAQQSDIKRTFSQYEVGNVFGRISEVDPSHQALKEFDPVSFLFDYLGSPDEIPPAFMRDFSSELFSIHTPRGIQLKSANIDRSLCSRWNSSERRLASFNLRTDRRFVMLTHLVTVGAAGSLRDLMGYPESELPGPPDQSGPQF